MHTREELAEHLKRESRVLASERLEEAFSMVDRAQFVRPDLIQEAYEDYPLPIGEAQTISQPTTVAFMLEKLDVEEGNTVLDVGSGSGWTTALLAHLAGEKGHVYGVERIPELVHFGRENLARAGVKNAEITQAGRVLGLPEHAPYDRILISAAARGDIPDTLIDQLKQGGVLVGVADDAIVQIKKAADGSIGRQEFPGFAFVPLISA